MRSLWLVWAAEFALAAMPRLLGQQELSAIALSLTTTMASWILARRSEDR